MSVYYGPGHMRPGRSLPTWKCCRAESPGGYSCTQRIAAGRATHEGDHVAGGRAEGERDSVITTWVQ